MSTTTTGRQIPKIETLKGVFSVPKVMHRRDFLRENKLNVKELQRLTSQNKQLEEQTQHDKLHKQQKQHQIKQQLYSNRRSDSQMRIVLENDSRRSLSEQRRSISRQQLNYHSGLTDNSYNQEGKLSRKKSTCSINSTFSKAESCDKEIQTDDIADEQFLQNALRKCSSSDVKSLAGSRYGVDEDYNDFNNALSYRSSRSNLKDINDKNMESGQEANTLQGIEMEVQQYPDELPMCNMQPSPRSQTNIPNGHCYSHYDEEPMVDEINNNFENLGIKNKHDDYAEQPLSGRSRNTLYSTYSQNTNISKKKSTGSVHKLGNREDLRLPRYLEKEKREKEEQRLRELSRDPHCPPGHVPLSETERLEKITKAELKFKTLIDELNGMPMTTETLRLRKRKMEIEKELAELEASIRLLSKSKVYVKQPD